MRLVATFGVLFLVFHLAHADGLRRGPSDGGNIADSFPRWESLTPKQRMLIHEESGMVSDDASFQKWAGENEDFAGTFLANTRALEKLVVVLDIADARPFIDLVIGMDHLEGDRIKVLLDKHLFEKWRSSGAAFSIHKADGSTEDGNFDFDSGDIGGSLHEGYDIQGYTSVSEAPRIQIQYRFEDGGADIDLDYNAPWIGGVIPNPTHLTWQNSDVRDHLDEYKEKFGDPGFGVTRAE